MVYVFTTLLLISVVFWVWGMVAPHQFAKHAKDGQFTRTTAGIGFGFFVLVFFVLVGITAPPQQPVASRTPVTWAVQHKPQVQADSVVTKQETETKPVPYSIQTQDDSNLPLGQSKITQTGKDGIETLAYAVTYTNDRQTAKTLVSDNVTAQPTPEIIANGTYVAPAPVIAPTPAPVPIPAPTPTPSPSCYPLTNGGNCYEPGEYCRSSDHGVSGVAGDGEAIVCAYNNGWRWEPQN